MSLPVALGTVIDERYRVDREIGVGGMGIVLQATHLVLNQPVAIKFLRKEAMADADAVKRFVREAQAAAKVQSEHIVRVHDVATLADGTPYLVMEYLEGEVLSSMLARGPLPIREAVRYAMQTCEALAVTHGAGIVHGDLKPENIYIAGVGDAPRRVKLLDFGISKIAFDDHCGIGSDVVMGTPAYMAPEQFRTGVVGPASDIWALGAVLYEMLTGSPPFLGETLDEIGLGVTTEPVAPIHRPDMPPGLDEIIRRCLEKNPRDRWSSAAQLAAALEAYAPVETTAKGLVGSSTPPTVRTSQKFVPTVVLPNRRKGYGTWAFAGIGMAFVALVLLLAGAMRHFTTQHEPHDPSAAHPLPTSASASGTPSTTASAESLPSPFPSAMSSSEPSSIATPPSATPNAAAAPARVGVDTSKRVAAPPRRPRTSPRSGGRPVATETAPPTEDDGDRFGTRK